jgi:Flp pilus assembly protein TadG
VLLIVLFSLIDFGRLMHAKLQLAEAAREGARAAALQTGEDATNTVDRLVGGMKANMTPYDINICGNNPAPGQDASVTLTYRFEFVTPLPGLGVVGDGITLTQTAVMPCL